MALNLVRNAKVFFTTNTDTAGTVQGANVSPFGTNNTFEIQVLEGLSFSQNTNTETVIVAEAGSTPTRGQRTFNTSLAPVDFSFSTYIRPKDVGGNVTAEESFLWNALLSSKPISTAIAGSVTAATYTSSSSQLVLTTSGAATLVAGEIVRLSGITGTTAAVTELNGEYRVVSQAANTLTLIAIDPHNADVADANITKTNIKFEKINAAYLQLSGTVTATYTTATNKLLISATTSLAAPGIAVNDVVTLNGLVATVGQDKLNGAAKVTALTATTIELELARPFTTATVITVPATNAVRITESAWSYLGGETTLITTMSSDSNTLQVFGLLFLVDNVMYAVDKAVLTQATVDFGLDGITSIQWTGQASAMREFDSGITYNAGVFTNGSTNFLGATARALPKVTDSEYLVNKLTAATLSSLVALGDITTSDTFPIALTGGSVTINNNVTYLTPALLGTVNIPATYFTGTRSITGTMNAYLRTGASTSTRDIGYLLKNMLAQASSTVEPKFSLTISLGGSTGTRVELLMPTTVIGIPAVDVQQIVSATINFTAQGYDLATNTYDLTKANDLEIRYYA